MNHHIGIGDPPAELGIEGDDYIDRRDGSVWYKIMETCSFQAVLYWKKMGQVPVGIPGEPGRKGDAGGPGSPGVGVPAGGTTGQQLAKTSGTDYDTEWVDAATSVNHIEIQVFGG